MCVCVCVCVSLCVCAGDDGSVQSSERGGVGEAEAACSGEASLSGEPVASRRAGQHTAEAAEERAERGTAGGGEEAPGVHEPAEEVRRGRVSFGEIICSTVSI